MRQIRVLVLPLSCGGREGVVPLPSRKGDGDPKTGGWMSLPSLPLLDACCSQSIELNNETLLRAAAAAVGGELIATSQLMASV